MYFYLCKQRIRQDSCRAGRIPKSNAIRMQNCTKGIVLKNYITPPAYGDDIQTPFRMEREVRCLSSELLGRSTQPDEK